MNCQEILTTLVWFKKKLIDVLAIDPNTTIAISSQYSFITAVISTNNKPDIHVSFEISTNSTTVESIHCDDKSIDADTKSKIQSITWPGFNTTTTTQLPWPNEILQQIDAADNIASLTVNCTTGDNYRPGNFSKVLIATNHIELQQINYMNAKSLAHKNDYSLRSLVFRIPLSGDQKMITEFTDRSSDNNRHCGDKIKTALDWLPH